MNGIIVGFKKFFLNKNTVTILGVVLMTVVLYFGYNFQISSQTSPMTVFRAKETIQPRTKIDDGLVEMVTIPKAALTENVAKTKNQIVGKYSNYNTIIPAGSMFYLETLVNEDELPDIDFSKAKEGEVLYNFPVSTASTFGNAMLPKKRIDMYMKAVDASGQIMVGKLLENIEIISVKDSSGNNVFESSKGNRQPAYLLFSLDPELNILLRKASYLSSASVELFPVPQGGEVNVGADVKVSSKNLEDFINARTVVNDEFLNGNLNSSDED